MPSCIALLVLLACARDGQRVGGHVLRDRRSSCRPCSVSDLDRRDEAILDPDPDVVADPGAAFRHARLVREVCGDRAGPDVRVLAHLGITDVGEVRDLGARPMREFLISTKVPAFESASRTVPGRR